MQHKINIKRGGVLCGLAFYWLEKLPVIFCQRNVIEQREPRCYWHLINTNIKILACKSLNLITYYSNLTAEDGQPQVSKDLLCTSIYL